MRNNGKNRMSILLIGTLILSIIVANSYGVTVIDNTGITTTSVSTTSLTVALINNTAGYVQTYRLLVENGSSFPATVSNGYLFFRTDYNTLCFYNGTDWSNCTISTDLSAYMLKDGTTGLTANWNLGGSYGVYGATWLNSTQINADDFWWNGQNRTDAVANPIGSYSYLINASGSTYSMKNGVTGQIDFQSSNASATINNAIGNMTNGGKVFVKNATYSLDSTILINQNNTVLEGEGKGTILYLANGANVNVINITDCFDVTVKHLMIHGNNGLNTAGRGIHIHNSVAMGYGSESEITIQDVLIYHTVGDALRSDGAEIENRIICVATNGNYGNGYGFYISSTDNKIELCTAALGALGGFYLAGASNQLVDCKAYGCALSSGAGFEIVAPRNFLTNCYAQDNYNHGFLLSGAADYSSLIGCAGANNGINNTAAGLKLDTNSATLTDTIISGCEFSDYQAVAEQDYGIWSTNGNFNGTIITGNICSGNVLDGIYNIANQAFIKDNYCYKNGRDGIRFGDGGSDDSIAENNRCQNNTGYGINIASGSCDRDVVRFNYVTGNVAGQVANSGVSTTIKFNVGFVTENSVSSANTTATTAVINHGLASNATYAWCSFNDTSILSYTWTSDATQITITVTGTLPASWTCYVKVEYVP